MHVLLQPPDDYVATQIARSSAKWPFCNVSEADVQRYRRLVGAPGLVGCMGVRNGMEVDLFRVAFGQAQGVEINPMNTRKDVWIGSFSEMPADWTDRFDVVYSNAFDHAYHPVATAREWRRVLKPGGTLILAYVPDQPPTLTDPVGELTERDLLALFGGAVRWRGMNDAGYHELALA